MVAYWLFWIWGALVFIAVALWEMVDILKEILKELKENKK